MKMRFNKRHLALAAGSLVVALGIAEVVVRFIAPPTPCIRFEQDVEELRFYELPDAIETVESDPELFWRLVPDLTMPTNAWPFFGLISNSQGLREDHVIPKAKKADELRILFLGDSCTFGYGVPYDKTFVEITESLLKAKYPNTPIECINAGVPGYSLFQGWRYLETQGLKYKPDIVVLNFGWNDASPWDSRSDQEHYEAMKASQPPGILGRSRLCGLLWRAISPPMEPGGPPPGKERPRPAALQENDGRDSGYGVVAEGETMRVRVNAREFGVLLKKVKYLTGKHGIDLLVIAWPGQGNTLPETPTDFRTEMQKEMIRFGRKQPMPDGTTGALDLVPLAQHLVNEHGDKAIYFDKAHVTALVHAAIAKSLADKLSPWMENRRSK